MKLPSCVYSTGSVPHSWLLPQCRGIVHHGGYGTTAAGLHAGIPAMVIPHLIDQFYWGQRIYDLGVGPKPVPRKNLEPGILASSITELIGDYKVVDVNIEEAPIYRKLSLSNLFEFGAIEGAFTYAGDLKPKDCFLRYTPRLGFEIWQVQDTETFLHRDVKTHQGTARMMSPSTVTFNFILHKVKDYILNGTISLT